MESLLYLLIKQEQAKLRTFDKDIHTLNTLPWLWGNPSRHGDLPQSCRLGSRPRRLASCWGAAGRGCFRSWSLVHTRSLGSFCRWRRFGILLRGGRRIPDSGLIETFRHQKSLGMTLRIPCTSASCSTHRLYAHQTWLHYSSRCG